MTQRGGDSMDAARLVPVFAAALILCLGALVATLLVGLGWAQHVLDRAGRAQTQLAAVSAIEASVTGLALARIVAPAEEYARRRALMREVTVYRRSVAEEHPGSRPTDEGRDAERLTVLATNLIRAPGGPGSAAALDALHRTVTVIARRERSEVAATEDDMARLRMRMVWLASLIAGAAAGLAALAGAGMRSANRRLAGQVRSRTAELEAKGERLAQIDRSRRLFFAKLGHELRTPVTVMRGEAEVALRDPAADRATLADALDHVVANAGFLNRRLDELIAVARSEDGRLTLQIDAIDMRDAVMAARESALPFARSSDVVLTAEVPAHPVPIRGDRRWIEQALLAILDNGVKFSSPGEGLTMQLATTGDRARIAISDAGEGIDPAAIEHMFDPYFQAEAGRARGGSGLGLSLARWVVEHHDGTVAAVNAPGGGCTVTIDLPVCA